MRLPSTVSRLLLASGLLLSSVACSPSADSKDPVAVATFENEKRIEEQDITKKQKQDAAFLVTAMADGLLDRELATLALQKAATPSVRNFAQRVLDQHIQINGELKNLAEQKNIALPASMGKDRQETYQTLNGLTGTAFDKKYTDTLVDSHDDDVDAYQDMSKDAYDGDIRGFAAKYLPVLQQHLQEAKQVQDEVQKLP